MSKDCPNCLAFGKHCPHKVNGDPYFYDCYLTVAELEKENAELKKQYAKECEDAVYVVTDYTKQLTKAKELLAKWVELCKPKLEGYPITPIQEQTEQFLNNEVEK